MPWKVSSVEERLRFVGRLLDGESMSDVCREFGISRKTGYKIYSRYREHGLFALTDRSRRPVRYANQLPQQVESLIVNLKRDKPHWGAGKIRELLVSHLVSMDDRRWGEWSRGSSAALRFQPEFPLSHDFCSWDGAFPAIQRRLRWA